MNNNEYEAMFIFKSAASEVNIADVTKDVQDIIRRNEGSIDNAIEMGRRRLAYPIDHHVEGYYYLMRFSSPTPSVDKIEKALKLNESVIRFMILKKENAPVVQPTELVERNS